MVALDASRIPPDWYAVQIPYLMPDGGRNLPYRSSMV
jgi:hypothetical protein